ncbi:glucose-6-phosphate isomerase [Candidatus Bathyarchaeota archaeon]|nr:glucose-6-phosphate isomerase [Candidatus Bathyarchaeota archaeon]
MNLLDVKPLDLKYDEKTFLLFMDDTALDPSVRRLKDLHEVAYDKNFLNRAKENIPVYYIYRNVCREMDWHLFVPHKIRHDISLIPAFNIGKEFVKTLGHYHPIAEGKLTYPEVYEIVSGEAHYLLQKIEGSKVVDVVVVDAKEGDKVIIPPDYGHVTINPSERTLIMANLVSTQFNPIYQPMREMGGAAYYELKGHLFVKNERYFNTPQIRFCRPSTELRSLQGNSLYSLFLKNPGMFEYLNKPLRLEKSALMEPVNHGVGHIQVEDL